MLWSHGGTFFKHTENQFYGIFQEQAYYFLKVFYSGNVVQIANLRPEKYLVGLPNIY